MISEIPALHGKDRTTWPSIASDHDNEIAAFALVPTQALKFERACICQNREAEKAVCRNVEYLS